MFVKKLAVAGCVIASLGVGTGPTALMFRRVWAQVPPAATAVAIEQRVDSRSNLDRIGKQPPAAGAATKQETEPAPAQEAKAQHSPADPLIQRLLDSARQRFNAQLTYYEEGRITLDRFVDACTQLEKAELLAAADERERMAARQKYVDLLTEIVNREQAELQVGRGTVADVAEAKQRREAAEIELRTAREDFDQYEAKALKLVEAARQRYQAQEALFKEGRITIDRVADASLQLTEAEVRTAKTDFERIAARKRHLDRLKAIEAQEERELAAGQSTKADLTEASTRRIEAELELHEAVNKKGAADLIPILRRLGELERKVEQLEKEQGARGRP
jgi:hypothetical protein